MSIHVYTFVVLDGNYTYANCTDGDVRLMNGATESEGRVEICYNEVWGTVCSSAASDMEGFSNLVCKQLGYQPKSK